MMLYCSSSEERKSELFQDGFINTHSNYCDMMFEIKVMKIVINNCQQLSTTVNYTQLQSMPAQALLTAVNKSQLTPKMTPGLMSIFVSLNSRC